MSTVVVGEQDWLTEVVRERQRLGQDLFDEVWEGVHHVVTVAATEHARVAAEVLGVLHPRARQRGLISSTPFNLGFAAHPSTGQQDFRVPDGGWFRERPHGTYAETAVVVLEVLSPGDETYEKFGFFFARGVQEVLVAHPTERWVRCYRRGTSAYEEADDSQVFGVTTEQLVAEVDWP